MRVQGLWAPQHPCHQPSPQEGESLRASATLGRAMDRAGRGLEWGQASGDSAWRRRGLSLGGQAGGHLSVPPRGTARCHVRAQRPWLKEAQGGSQGCREPGRWWAEQRGPLPGRCWPSPACSGVWQRGHGLAGAAQGMGRRAGSYYTVQASKDCDLGPMSPDGQGRPVWKAEAWGPRMGRGVRRRRGP